MLIARRDLTVPNGLTCLRIMMTVIAGFMFTLHGHESIAATICIAASFLDYFDGWYARRFHQTTRLGAHLDPFADKVMIAVIFVTLGFVLRWGWFTVCVSIILAREIVITFFRFYTHRRKRVFIKASRLGKAKTLIQCIVGDMLLFYVFIYPEKVPSNVWLIFGIMALTTFVTIDSGLRYLLPRCADGKRRSAIERLYHLVFGVRAREV